MSSKVLLFSALCLLCSCFGDQNSSQGTQEDIPMQPLDATPDDLDRDASRWSDSWRPWKFFNWGQSPMFNKALAHSSKLWESDNKGHHIHHDQSGRGKIKNKVKLLLKIHQFQK